MRDLFRTRHARAAVLAAGAVALGGAVLGASAWTETKAAPVVTEQATPLADAMAARLLTRAKWTGLVLAAQAGTADAPVAVETDFVLDGGSAGPAAPFYLKASSVAERERAVRCLATAIYYEAALESELGQRAVAQVVLNRVRDPNFPKSVCGVVYQGWERTTGCQFSFTCDGALLRGRIPLLYARAEDYARDALNGAVVSEVGTATHYHADYVSPYWGPSLVKIGQVGAHIFYRWPGAPGLPSAFTGRYRGGELALSEAVLTGRAARPTPPPGEELLTDGLLIKTVLMADPANPDVLTERVRGVIAPGGRRLPTALEIAEINARLRAYETGAPGAPTPAAPAGPTAEPAAPSAPAAAATGDAVPVVEINKPAPAPSVAAVAPASRRASVAPIPSLPSL
jgi:hypothetical protein